MNESWHIERSIHRVPNSSQMLFFILKMEFFFFRTDFVITASQDGHVKFWKKREDEGIEFVKHFRSHLGTN